MKSGNLNFLQPSGPLQVSNGTALPLPLPLPLPFDPSSSVVWQCRFYFVFHSQNYQNWFAVCRRNPWQGRHQGTASPHRHVSQRAILSSGRRRRLRFETCARAYIFRRHIQCNFLFSLSRSSISHLFCPSASSDLRLFPIFFLFLFLHPSFLSPYFVFPSPTTIGVLISP
jgi:hypothetical protein